MASLGSATWTAAWGNKGWTLALHLQAEGVASKVGEFDESVTIDQPQMGFLNRYVGRCYAQKKKDGKLNERVVICETNKYKTFAAAFKDAATKLRLPQLPVAHQLRHAGPSVDRAGNRRPLTEVKRRGRWAADRSVKRYEKSGLVDLQLAALPVPVLQFCEEALTEVPNALDGGWTPSLPRWLEKGRVDDASWWSPTMQKSKRGSTRGATKRSRSPP